MFEAHFQSFEDRSERAESAPRVAALRAELQKRSLDGFIRRRLRSLLRKQEKRPGFGRCVEDQRRWSNAFFADRRLFTLKTAFDDARDSR